MLCNKNNIVYKARCVSVIYEHIEITNYYVSSPASDKSSMLYYCDCDELLSSLFHCDDNFQSYAKSQLNKELLLYMYFINIHEPYYLGKTRLNKK